MEQLRGIGGSTEDREALGKYNCGREHGEAHGAEPEETSDVRRLRGGKEQVDVAGDRRGKGAGAEMAGANADWWRAAGRWAKEQLWCGIGGSTNENADKESCSIVGSEGAVSGSVG